MTKIICIEPPDVPTLSPARIIIHRSESTAEEHVTPCGQRILIHRHSEPNIIIHRAQPATEFEAPAPVEIDEKTLEIIEDGETGVIVDARGVTIEGYLSDFGNTPDRQGDIVAPGAFSESVAAFKVRGLPLLVDHVNRVESLVGHFTALKEDSHGLWFRAAISNAPGLTDLRMKIVEGHVRSVSMGGRFSFAGDGKTITQVELFEGSIVSIPANDRAVFGLRSADSDGEKMTHEPEGIEADVRLTADQRRTLSKLSRGAGRLRSLLDAVRTKNMNYLNRNMDPYAVALDIQWNNDLTEKFKTLLESAAEECPEEFVCMKSFDLSKLLPDQRQAVETLAAMAKTIGAKSGDGGWHKLGRVLHATANPFQTK